MSAPGPTEHQRSLTQRLGFATFLMVLSIFLSRVVGFVREVVIAAQYGATGDTDAYFAAFTLPDLLNYFLAGGTLSVTFIPLFSGYLARGEEKQGWSLYSTVTTAIGMLVLAAVIVGEIFADSLVPLLVPGFAQAELELCIRLTRIVMPGMFFFAIGTLLQATLLSKERFGWVSTIPVVYNLCIIIGGVALGPWLGVAGFAWGALAGAFFGAFLIPLAASWRSVRYRPSFNFRTEAFARYIKLTWPLMLGVSLVSFDEWFLRYFGSYLEKGTVSWLNNARRLMLLPIAIIGQAASQAALPFLSRLFAEDRQQDLADTLTRSLQSVLFYAALAAAAIALLAEPIVFAAFQRGDFTPRDASGTAALLALLALGIASWNVQLLTARGYYACNDTLRPMLIGTLVVILSFPIYMGLMDLWGAPGLAAASAIGITLNALTMLTVFRLKHAPIDLGALAATLGRVLLCGVPAAAATALLVRETRTIFNLESTPQALLLLVLGAAVFGLISLAIAWRLNAPELAFIRRIIAKLRRRA